jgi:hypothetical protein
MCDVTSYVTPTMSSLRMFLGPKNIHLFLELYEEKIAFRKFKTVNRL